MSDINPMAILLIALATAVGAVAGSWLIGLCVGLFVVLFSTIVAGLDQ